MKTIVPVGLIPNDPNQFRKQTERLGRRLAAALPALLEEKQLAYYSRHPDALINACRSGIAQDCAWRHAESIAKAVTFIKQTLPRKLTEGEVAAVAGMSIPHFSSVFKKHTGKTFVQFVAHLRVKHTKSLLARPGRNRIGDIACVAGFASLDSFNRVFKRYTHKTASEYRRAVRV